MKTLSLFFTTMLLSLNYLISQTTFSASFEMHVGDSDEQICVLSDSSYALVGSTFEIIDSSYKHSTTLVVIDKNGETLVSKTYKLPFGHRAVGIHELHQETGFLILSVTYTDSIPYSFLIRTDDEGDTLWTKLFLDHWSADLFVELDNSEFLIVGRDNESYNLLKIGAAGNIIWGNSISVPYDPYYGRKISVERASFGGFLISATVVSPYNYVYNHDSMLVVGPDPRGYDILLTLINDTGDLVWSNKYGSLMGEYAFGLAPSLDNGWIISGCYMGTPTDTIDEKTLVMKVSSNGDSLWTCIYWEMNFANSVIVTSSNDYVLCGKMQQGDSSHMKSIAVTSTGDVFWTKNFNSVIGYVVKQTLDGGLIWVGNGYDGTTSRTDIFKTGGISSPTSINELNGVDDIEVFPNPSIEVLNIYGVPEETTFKLHNLSGNEVLSSRLVPGANEIKISNLTSGIYLYRIGEQKTGKVIIKEKK